MAEDTFLRRRWRRVLGVTGTLGAVEGLLVAAWKLRWSRFIPIEIL
jgi:hypothetical protein